jgi:hypothetical protein
MQKQRNELEDISLHQNGVKSQPAMIPVQQGPEWDK